MGVLSCSRSGCDNIMCDTYVSEVGYICYECRKEFENYLMIERVRISNEFDVKDELKRFMDTYQGKYLTPVRSFDIDEFFQKYTR